MSKSVKKIDLGQRNIFDIVSGLSERQSAVSAPAPCRDKISVDAAIRALISDALKRSPLSRYEVAARMSEALGVEITKAQLDSWSAESKENHRFPLVYAAAFCNAVADTSLVRYLAELCGGYYIEGEEAVHLALGRIEREEEALRKKKQILRQIIGQGGDGRG